MGLKRWNVAVVVALGATWCAGTTQREKPLVGAVHSPRIDALEDALAAHPDSPDNVRELAKAYLDARASGMALSLIEEAPTHVREEPTVLHMHARALIEQGRSVDALAVERKLLATCAKAPTPACSQTLVATATRYERVLEELVQLGIDDPNAHPEASRVAYVNGAHPVRFSAE